MVDVTREQVWKRLNKAHFMVVGMVTARQEARTVGVVPKAYQGELWYGSVATEWKVRHVRANPHVSVTVPIQRGIPPIPPATITFAGRARVIDTLADAPQPVVKALTSGVKETDAHPAVVVAIAPVGDFITYGIGVSLWGMLDTEKARGRVPNPAG